MTIGELDPIAGMLFEPETPPRAAVVIHAATATPQHYYASFATYLTGHGLAVLTYDYRGTGRSGSPKAHRHIRMRDWIMHDVPATTEWMWQQYPGIPHLAVGHSVGGHALALGYGGENLDRAVLIASHAGATHTIPGLVERARVSLVLHVVGPLLGTTLGYIPMRRLGLGEDLPAAAAIEWGDWARKPNYFYDDPTMNAHEQATTVTCPVLAIGFNDDPWATPTQVDAITTPMVNAQVVRRTYAPADAGMPSIRHHGFLRSAARDKLWAPVVDWITAGLAPTLSE